MSIMTEQEAKTILDKVCKLSKADECTAQLTGSVDGNVRYALNSVSTSGIVNNSDLAVQVAFGKRVGTATINEFDDASLEKVVRRAEELAQASRRRIRSSFPRSKSRPTSRATRSSKRPPRSRRNTAPGRRRLHRAVQERTSSSPPDSSPTAARFTAIANTKGNFGFQKSTNVDFTCTVRTDDGAARAGSRAISAMSASSTRRTRSRRPCRRPRARSTPKRSNPASTP